MHKVLIDINSCTLKRGQHYLPGIGRATAELVKALSHMKTTALRFELYSQYVLSRMPGKGSFSALRKLHFPFPGSATIKDLVTRMGLKELTSRYDLLHIPHTGEYVRYPGRTVLTIHDTLDFIWPKTGPGGQSHRAGLRKLAGSCRAIATCSASSAKDIVQFLEVPPDKVTVIPWGISKDVFFAEDNSITRMRLAELGIRIPYFLAVSCGTGRKNTAAVLQAFRCFLQRGGEASLAVVWPGMPRELQKAYSREINAGRMRLLADISDSQLRSLYCGATGTVHLSRYEGFGFVPLESMACGTPVITGQHSAIQETCGGNAVYVPWDDPSAVADTMEALLSERDIRPLEVLQRHVQRFNWDETARQYMNFYLAAL